MARWEVGKIITANVKLDGVADDIFPMDVKRAVEVFYHRFPELSGELKQRVVEVVSEMLHAACGIVEAEDDEARFGPLIFQHYSTGQK